MELYSHGSDVLIFGAGVIGLSLALELRRRGASVTVADRSSADGQASTAAAGMLAVHDPHNPPQLQVLAEFSAGAYPEYLHHVEGLSGLEVPFQTNFARQTLSSGFVKRLAENSLDPRQLLPALRRAVVAAGVRLQETDVPAPKIATNGESIVSNAATVVHTTGAWTALAPVFPRKGQMLRVRMPRAQALDEVYRAEHVYLVPRTQGPQAGTALIGATVEDAGFDLTTDPGSLQELRRRVAELVPGIIDPALFPSAESWAGLRPATPDGLPLLGSLPQDERVNAGPRAFVAAGHYRNGILLAPGTAIVMADLVQGLAPSMDLTAFSPDRFRGAA